ncbi:MAG: DUF4124 domain-containing protein [Halofilum sp. (in: g-proteobacteria)]|nr:DUF4124 domain-containing protein [Halofilum sp. (in: g-proteobacteria)]
MTRSALLAMLALPLLLPAVTGIASAADVYRWVDDEGVVHFTQNPPNDRDSVKLDAANPPADDPEARREQVDQLEEEIESTVERRRMEREGRAADRAREEQRQQRCRQLRDDRERLMNTARVREGEDYRVITPEERKQKLEQYNRRIEELCNLD